MLAKIISIEPVKPCPIGSAASIITVEVFEQHERDEDYCGRLMLIEVEPFKTDRELKPRKLHLLAGSSIDPWPSADPRLENYLSDMKNNRGEDAPGDCLHEITIEVQKRLERVTFAEFTDAAVAAAAPFEQQTLRLFMGEIPKDEQDDLIDFEDPSEARTVERLLVRAWNWQEVRLNNRNLGDLREKARRAA